VESIRRMKNEPVQATVHQDQRPLGPEAPPEVGQDPSRVKLKSKRTGKEYPCETPYFICPPEVQKVYGEKPTELDIMLPLNDPEAVFPQRYIWYGSAKGAKYMGEGEKAIRLNEETGELDEHPCPCEVLSAGCSERAHLLVILPRVNVAGVYQIDVGSYHSIVDINSAVDYIQALVGRLAMVPLKLRRVPRETHGSGRKEIHYPLQITLDGDINLINALRENTTRVLASTHYALPAPVAENPVMDDGAIVEVEEEPPEEQATPAEDAPPTPEEVLEDMKAAGMIPADTQATKAMPANINSPEEPTKEQKDAWAKEFQMYVSAVQGFTNMPELNKWFVRIRKESGLPEKYLNELVIQINERLLKLKNGK